MPLSFDLTNLPDADVAALAKQGREEAFRELIRRYERPVFSLVFRMVRDRETAEDLAQDTFVKVLNHIDRYRPEFKLSSWLFKIANNVTIDYLRKRQLDTVSMDGSPHAGTASEVEATSFDVEGACAQVEVRPSRLALPAQLGHRRAAPPAVDVEAEEVIQEVVPRGDLGEDAPHVRALLGAARRGRERLALFGVDG